MSILDDYEPGYVLAIRRRWRRRFAAHLIGYSVALLLMTTVHLGWVVLLVAHGFFAMRAGVGMTIGLDDVVGDD